MLLKFEKENCSVEVGKKPNAPPQCRIQPNLAIKGSYLSVKQMLNFKRT